MRPDIDAVQRRMSSNSRLVVHELEALSKVLGTAEQLQWAATAKRSGDGIQLRKAPTLGGMAAKAAVKALIPRPSASGLLACSDRRLLYLDGKGRRALIDSVAVGDIQSTQWEAGLVFGQLTVTTASGRVTYTQIIKSDGREIIRLVDDQRR